MKVDLFDIQPFTQPHQTLSLDIKPLTILTGDNGVGKSKLIRSIGNTLDYRVYVSRVIDPTGEDRSWEKSTAYYVQNQNQEISVPIPVLNKDTGKYTFDSCNGSILTFSEVIQDWFYYFGLGNITLTDRGYYKVLNIDKTDIRDIGRGYNHLIAILIQVISALVDHVDILYLINPETFLSADLQAKLTDFIVTLATYNKCYIIVETHSDHIINRTVLRCMENPLTHAKSNILFLTKESNSLVKISNICIDPYIGLKDNSPNFFTLYGNEVKHILDVGYENLRKDKEV